MRNTAGGKRAVVGVLFLRSGGIGLQLVATPDADNIQHSRWLSGIELM